MMELLTESQVLQDLALLDRAWENPRTFALITDKCAGAQGFLQDAMRNMPGKLQSGHFALLTSGSTGEPKLVYGCRKRAEALVKVLHQAQDSSDVRETLLFLPLFYCYAFVNQWLWSRVFDRPLKVTGGFRDPHLALQALRAADNAMLCLVGAQVHLFAECFGGEIFPGITRLHFAGGAFPQEKAEALGQWFPEAKIFNNYGCAEAMPRLTLRRLEDSDDSRNIGFPLPGVQLRSDPDGNLQFRSCFGAVAWQSGSEFVQAREEVWVPTGDLGFSADNGAWVLTGRTGEVFKRYGEKISLSRLLQVVVSVWSGQALFYREADLSGEAGHVLFLSPEPTREQVKDILQAFRKGFSRPHWPLRMESGKSIPSLANGKPDILQLQKLTDKIVHWSQGL